MYKIYVKGWGEYEDSWYPQGEGNSILDLKTQTFENWDMEAEFYIKNTTTDLVIEEGIINKGIWS